MTEIKKNKNEKNYSGQPEIIYQVAIAHNASVIDTVNTDLIRY